MENIRVKISDTMYETFDELEKSCLNKMDLEFKVMLRDKIKSPFIGLRDFGISTYKKLHVYNQHETKS